ncbi:MAG: glycoside hydrolase family 127 protein, partial [Herbiconiux sp.]|nr:glycoside hydrolase family 127 protein [Herbiconiux sp.]
EAALAQEDADDLSLPETAATNLPLPARGANGSDIAWASSDEAVIAPDGTVTAPGAGEEDVTVTLTASVRFVDGPVVTRAFDVKVLAQREVLEDSGLGVRMDDDYLRNGLQKEHEYLLSLSSEKFLYWWYRTAGLTPTTAEGYAGWENGNTANNFRGHAFGHYLSGLAISYANTTDGATRSAMLEQLTDGVSGLAEVQASYAGKPDAYAGTADGYLAPFRTKAFSNIEGRGAGDPAANDPVIVPYYNLHKVLQGLLDVSRYVGGETGATALDVAHQLGRYLGRRMNTLADKAQMRGTEYGGMNEALYDLYEQVGGDPLVLDAAEAFDEVSLFTTVANGGDPLAGRHANTTIPKFIGALKRYTVFTQNPDLFAQLTPQEQAE